MRLDHNSHDFDIVIYSTRIKTHWASELANMAIGALMLHNNIIIPWHTKQRLSMDWQYCSLYYFIERVRYHLSHARVTIVWSLWRHQQLTVTSLAERKTSEWDTGTMCTDRVRNKIMYVLSWRTVYVLTRVLCWCLFPSLLRNSGNKHQNNPIVSAETVRHSSTYIILYSLFQRIISLLLNNWQVYWH